MLSSFSEQHDREAIIARYRALRAVGRKILNDTIPFRSKSAFEDALRHLGLMHKKTIVADSIDEVTLAMDLAIFGAKPGRSRAIDRFAQAHTFPGGSDEASVLQAMLHSRFGIFKTLRRHDVAGLMMKDLLRSGEELWLMDEGFEATVSEGVALATRILRVDTFWMTAGVAVPVDRNMMEVVLDRHPEWMRNGDRAFADSLRFAEAVYAESIRLELTQHIRFGSADTE